MTALKRWGHADLVENVSTRIVFASNGARARVKHRRWARRTYWSSRSMDVVGTQSGILFMYRDATTGDTHEQARHLPQDDQR